MRFLAAFIGILALAVPGQTQIMVEHAAAVAGAAIGTAGGKIVSNGLTALSESMAKSAAADQAKPEKSKKVEKPAPEAPVKQAATGYLPGASAPRAIAVGSGIYTPESIRRYRPSARAVAETPIVPEPVEPVVRSPSIEQLRQVRSGQTETEVLALGAPSARITIPDEGHLVEILHYFSQDATVATIRTDNGFVVSVETEASPSR